MEFHVIVHVESTPKKKDKLLKNCYNGVKILFLHSFLLSSVPAS